MSRGVVYIITQKNDYVGLLKTSITSLKRVMPSCPVTVFSEFPIESPYIDHLVRVEASNDGFYDKTRLLQETPYQQTLFLDADTCVLDSVMELYDLLEHFDLAVAHEEYVSTDWFNRYPRPDIHPCFPEFNTGVMVYKSSQRISALFKHWLELYTQFREDYPSYTTNDQPFFRVAMYYSNARVATLTREYNCKFRGQGYLNGKVKILHGHHKLALRPDYVTKVSTVLNASSRPRVYIAGKVYEHRIVGQLEGQRIAHKIGQFPEPPESIIKLRFQALRKRIRDEGASEFFQRFLGTLIRREITD